MLMASNDFAKMRKLIKSMEKKISNVKKKNELLWKMKDES